MLLYKSKEPSQYCLPKVDDTVCHHNHVTPLRFDNFECCSFWIRLFAPQDLLESLARFKCLGVNRPQKQSLSHSVEEWALARRYLAKEGKNALKSLELILVPM